MSDVPAYVEAREGFLDQLPAALVVELRADMSDERAGLVALRERNPAVVVALGKSAALAVAKHLPELPLVFGLVLEPGSLERRRATRAGFTLGIEPAAKIEELSRLISPLKCVEILCGPSGDAEARGLRAAANARGAHAHVRRCGRTEEIGPALRGLDPEVQVILLTTEPVFLRDEVGRAIVRRSHEKRIPVVGFSEKTVRIGGLAALEVDYRRHGEELARAALRVEAGEGADGRDRVRPASRYRWIVNPETARSLGIRLPPEVLASAKSALEETP